MAMRTNELILYRYMEHEDLLRDMTFLIDNADNDYYNKEDLKSLLFENLNELIELAANYGFEGNLWMGIILSVSRQIPAPRQE